MMMEKFLKEKKGSLPDVILFPLKVLITAVSLLLVGFFLVQFSARLVDTPLNDTAVGSKSIIFMDNIGANNIPKYFAILFTFDIIGLIVTSFLITLAPVFFVLYLIFVGFAIILAVFSEVFYDKFSQVTALQSYIASQDMINFIFNRATLIVLVIGAISAIIIMAKLGKQPGSRV